MKHIAPEDLAMLVEQLLRDLGPMTHTALHERLGHFVYEKDLNHALRLLPKNHDGCYEPRPWKSTLSIFLSAKLSETGQNGIRRPNTGNAICPFLIRT